MKNGTNKSLMISNLDLASSSDHVRFLSHI